MNCDIIIPLTLWIIWAILFFVHIINIFGIDGFSIKSFKSKNNIIIIENFEYNFYTLLKSLQDNNMIVRNNSLHKSILITIDRNIFSLTLKDPLFRFRTIIDYSGITNKVSIHWDNIWIYQLYIFIILIPSTIGAIYINQIIIIIFLIIIFLPFYYYCHKFEMLKVNNYMYTMKNILQRT